MKTVQGDYIGFTNEGDVGPISFSYNAERRTIFVGQNAAAMPRVGDKFQFQNQLQAFFSIAVLLTGQFDDLSQISQNLSALRFCLTGSIFLAYFRYAPDICSWCNDLAV